MEFTESMDLENERVLKLIFPNGIPGKHLNFMKTHAHHIAWSLHRFKIICVAIRSWITIWLNWAPARWNN